MTRPPFASEFTDQQSCSEKRHSFWDGASRCLSSIDGEQVIRNLPKAMTLLGTTAVAIWLLWLQSVELYAASGFTNPGIVALGGIIMVAGFAGYHSVYRSRLALLCCLYACSYETYFIASGTFADELQAKTEAVKDTKESHWLEEQLARAQAEYERQKARFENPNDREYQSRWFKKTFVDPTWEKYSEAQQELSRYLARTDGVIAFDHTGWLKIFYRLGLVLLCMLLMHRVVAIFRLESHPIK